MVEKRGKASTFTTVNNGDTVVIEMGRCETNKQTVKWEAQATLCFISPTETFFGHELIHARIPYLGGGTSHTESTIK